MSFDTRTLYVLTCHTPHGSIFYVGATQNLRRRLCEHNSGAGGSAWTRHWRRRGHVWRVATTEQVPLSSAGLHEDMHTLNLVRMYGHHRVRGGRFSQVVLPSARMAEIRHALRHNNGQSLAGGNSSHTVDTCPTQHRPPSCDSRFDAAVLLFFIACMGMLSILGY